MTTKVLPGMAKGLNQNTCTQHIQMRVYIPYPAGYASITYLHSVKVLTYMFQHVPNPNMIYVHSIPHIISIYIFPHQVITVPQHLPNSNCKALAQRDHDFWDLFTIDQSPQKIRGESDSNQACHQSFGHSRRDKMRTFFQKTERQRIFFKSFVRYLGDFHKKNSISCKALRSFKGCKKKSWPTPFRRCFGLFWYCETEQKKLL